MHTATYPYEEQYPNLWYLIEEMSLDNGGVPSWHTMANEYAQTFPDIATQLETRALRAKHSTMGEYFTMKEIGDHYDLVIEHPAVKWDYDHSVAEHLASGEAGLNDKLLDIWPMYRALSDFLDWVFNGGDD